MNVYSIQHKVRTLAQLHDETFEHAGFRFSQWDFNILRGPIGNAWIAAADIEAVTVLDAINAFRQRLVVLAAKIAIASQCYTMVEPESFLVQRRSNNDDQIFFFRFTQERGSTHLGFDDDEMNTLIALDKYQERGDFFRYLREAINATTFYTRLAMLLSALEAAAKAEMGGRLVTDREYIKNEILKDNALFDSLFPSGKDGIRNLLFHGWRVDFSSLGQKKPGLNEQIYSKLVAYLNNKHGTQISTGALGVPRNPVGIYEGANHWLIPKPGKVWPETLREITRLYDNRLDRDNPDHFWGRYDWVAMPADY